MKFYFSVEDFLTHLRIIYLHSSNLAAQYTMILLPASLFSAISSGCLTIILEFSDKLPVTFFAELPIDEVEF